MPRAPSAFPLLGRFRLQAINLTPSEGGLKPGGTAPWGQRYIQWWVTPDRTVWHATRPVEIWPTHWKATRRKSAPFWSQHHQFKSRTTDSGICCSPHRTGKYGSRPFYGGSGCRAVAHTHPAGSKNALGPVGIPLFGAPQALGDKPNPPEGGKSLGGRPPKTEGY